MKVVVSYINSKYDKLETIERINNSIADGIHVDLMDGLYVKNNNFNIDELYNDLKNTKKPLDVHLMCIDPSKYFHVLFKLNTACIYIHPVTEINPILAFEVIKKNNIEVGIVINPDEDINEYIKYFPLVNRVLLMSVKPGKGGQTFIEDTTKKLGILYEYKNKYNFKVYVDGGINDITVKKVSLADGVVCGSFICNSSNFDEQIKKIM